MAACGLPWYFVFLISRGILISSLHQLRWIEWVFFFSCNRELDYVTGCQMWLSSCLLRALWQVTNVPTSLGDITTTIWHWLRDWEWKLWALTFMYSRWGRRWTLINFEEKVDSVHFWEWESCSPGSIHKMRDPEEFWGCWHQLVPVSSG